MTPKITVLYLCLVPNTANLTVENLHGPTKISIVCSLTTKTDTLRFLELHSTPNLLLLETNALTVAELNFIQLIKEQYPTIRILISALSEDLETLRLSFENSTDGIIIGTLEPQELVYAIEQVTQNKNYLSPQIGLKYLLQLATLKHKTTNRITRSNYNVSKRELEVLKFIAEGFTNVEISEKLFSSKRTIEGNRKKLLEKTGTKNTAELVGFAIRNKFID